MRTLFQLPGPLRGQVWVHPARVFKRRYAFKGRPAHLDQPVDAAAAKDSLLPETPARTRFAPSPTGYLHLGSLRTALYNYLLAKATGGQFLLRLEDTDQSRLVRDAEPRLYEDLKWAGLNWDEGPDVGGPYGPYKQSERLDLYHEHANDLLASGQAYRCFCTPEDLEALKRYNMETSPNGSGQGNYNGKCTHVSTSESDRRAANGEPHCIRFRSIGKPEVRDLVYGRYSKPEKEDDFIIIKRDGFPTYHFANIIDDHAMGVTHVVRGAEWLVSTPRHAMLYDAFQWTAPIFAHVGLLCNSAGQKLSKRSGDIDISSYRDKGILPVALLNYAVLLGWSPGRGEKGTSEIMDLEEMIKKFHLRFTKGNIKISNKLPFIQTKHTARHLASLTEPEFERLYLPSIKETVANIHSSEDTRPGTLVPALRASPGAGGDLDLATTTAHSHLLSLFALDRKAFDGDVSKFVLRNRYLIWQTPADLLSGALSSSLSSFSSLHLLPSSATATTKPDRDQVLDGAETAVSPRALVSMFDMVLTEQIPEEAWSSSSSGFALEERINALCNQIYAQPRAVDDGDAASPNGAKRWGHQLLRWVLFAGQPGPAMVQSMLLLGRDEVLKRVGIAGEAARKFKVADKGTV
ncbi:hypothetical protein BKA67DRAFT_80929 [Truncatella angustata]|uniref:Glutamate--tRNA ligase, mitochondrial n=1 Tax=Truncatella angustata TaxID=152316 RepID=A0A9P9A4L3_9PEZI|nr:uncharacterized protein BKA67DRAFT_80929 [Truncatella angustata]KAH6661278.1 hypothetical protein BKA67DRAFT_80929 [Truncatella angustata]